MFMQMMNNSAAIEAMVVAIRSNPKTSKILTPMNVSVHGSCVCSSLPSLHEDERLRDEKTKTQEEEKRRRDEKTTGKTRRRGDENKTEKRIETRSEKRSE